MRVTLPSLALLAISPAAAMAQDGQQELVLEGGVLSCVTPVRCSASDTCEEGRSCSHIGGDNLNDFCTYGEDSFLCCGSGGPGDADSDCVIVTLSPRSTVMGTCVLLDDVPGVPGVCVFDEGSNPSFCPPYTVPERNWIDPCLTEPTMEITDDWREGDCDGDGVTNVDDLGCACDSTSAPSPDGGCAPVGADAGPGDATPDPTPSVTGRAPTPAPPAATPRFAAPADVRAAPHPAPAAAP